MSGKQALKLMAITVAAALAAWLTAVGIFWEDGGPTFGELLDMFPRVLLITGLIGFPVAAILLSFAGQKLARSANLFGMMVLLICVMLVLSSYWIMGQLGILFLGTASVMAALTYAVLGWFWVLRPLREHENG